MVIHKLRNQEYAGGLLASEGLRINVAKLGSSKKLFVLPDEEARITARLPRESSVSLYVHPREFSQLVFGWDATALICREPGYAVVAALETHVSWTTERIGGILRELWKTFPCEYGIGYSRDSGKGPDLYAIGLSSGIGRLGPDADEALAISRWMREGLREGVYRMGLLRDVYAWNALNAAQLTAEVAGSTLREWISKSPGRGALAELPRDGGLWHVPAGRLDAIQKALRLEGILL